MNEFKAVIFDWDGTLFDSVKYAMGVYQRLFEALGVPAVHWANFREEFKADYHKYYAEKGILPSTFAEVDRMWMELYQSGERDLKLVPGAKKVLEFLHENKFKVGLVSNGSGDRIRREMKEHGVTEYFKVIVTGDDIPEFKPSPKGVVYALGALRVKPGEAIYVGDMADDIIAGRKAGTKTAAVATGIHTIKKMQKEEPDYLLEDVTGLLELLK